MDIFTTEDVQKLFHNKFVAVIGDSVQRGVYKDLVYLLQNNTYLGEFMLKQKGEPAFCLDELVEGGRKGVMHNGKDYREVRQYQSDYYLIRYYYITRCYNEYIETIFLDFENGQMPDLLIMNSCVWDITRYGPNGYEKFQKNIQLLFSHLRRSLSESCLCLWLTTLPIGSDVSGGFLLPELGFYNDTLRFDVVISNYHAQQVAADYKIDVLDLHHHFRELTMWRKGDGIHWNSQAHRRITQLILTHVCESWDVGLPQRRPGLHKQWASFMHEDDRKIGRIHDNSNRVRPARVHERSSSCVANFDHLGAHNQPEVNNNELMQVALETVNIFADCVSHLNNNGQQSSYSGGPTRSHNNNRSKPYRR